MPRSTLIRFGANLLYGYLSDDSGAFLCKRSLHTQQHGTAGADGCHTIAQTRLTAYNEKESLPQRRSPQNIPERNVAMPNVFLSPSTQEWNEYATSGNEELYMNLLADRLQPYLRSSGIRFVRNDPERNVQGAIADSNAGSYDVHLALHSNAAPENLAGKLRGVDVYFAPGSSQSEKLANIIANNMKSVYPLPDKVRAVPTRTLGEVLRTKAVAVLAEIGYHDNYSDEAWLKNNLETIAANLARSLCDYFGIPFVQPSAVRWGTVVTDGSNLNIRSYPSTDGRIIGSIPNGASVMIDGETGGWYVVSYGSTTGYSSGDYIII